jgi:hypothetical protein
VNWGHIVRCWTVIALITFAAVLFGCGKLEATHGTAPRNTAIPPAEKSAALPDDFPGDVPVLKNATVKVAMSQGGRMIVHLSTSTSVSDAAKFYNGEFKRGGWNVEDTSTSSELYSATARKGATVCGVTISKEGKLTLVRLAVSPAGS